MGDLQTVLITGLSGSGKSTAIHTLEDMGFFCIDNLPSKLVSKFTESGGPKEIKKLAITMDAREPRFLANHRDVLQKLRKASKTFDVIFLEADAKSLQRRFSVTRRRHPLARGGSVAKAIRQEINSLKPLRQVADKIIDTTKLTPRALNQILVDYFTKRGVTRTLEISIISFGFHFGTPDEADLILDVRFLPNPYNHPKLRRFHGKNSSVKKFVLSQQATQTFLKLFLPLLKFLIPSYRKEGKSYLTIGIGCTGGQHRSVVVAEEIFQCLKKSGEHCAIIHRDLGEEK